MAKQTGSKRKGKKSTTLSRTDLKAMSKAELVNRAVYLANKLNTKYRSFKTEGYGSVYQDELNYKLFDVFNATTTDKRGKELHIKSKSGNITKSKQYYDSYSEFVLIELIRNMQEVHTDSKLQTVKVYDEYIQRKRVELIGQTTELKELTRR